MEETKLLNVRAEEPELLPDGRHWKGVKIRGMTHSTKTSPMRIPLKDVVAVAVKLERPWT